MCAPALPPGSAELRGLMGSGLGGAGSLRTPAWWDAALPSPIDSCTRTRQEMCLTWVCSALGSLAGLVRLTWGEMVTLLCEQKPQA